jgi:hypothetical protein
VEATKQKEEKRKNLSPKNRKACHSTSTALPKSDIHHELHKKTHKSYKAATRKKSYKKNQRLETRQERA